MTDLWRNLRLFLVESVIYACFIAAYFLLVLRGLGGWIIHVFDSNTPLYAILALSLISIQGLVLEKFTTWLLRIIERMQGIALVLRRLARPHETVIAPKEVPGLLVYRFAGILFFFNASRFAGRVQNLIDIAATPVSFLLINAEAIIDMDVYAAETLADLDDSLSRQGINFGICGAKGHFLRVLHDIRVAEGLKLVLYPSVAVAIKEITKKNPKTE
jgi:hypothetical protein